MILAITTGSTILYSIIVFLLVIIALVSILLIAKAKLSPQGEVKLKINDKELNVSPGSSLLSTLTGNGIFLPSACGGGGTCGMCKCQVTDGAMLTHRTVERNVNQAIARIEQLPTNLAKVTRIRLEELGA